MLFERYRNKSKSTTILPNDKKKTSLAYSLFKRFPINLTSHKKKPVQLQNNDIVPQPRSSISLPNIPATLTNTNDINTTTTTTLNTNTTTMMHELTPTPKPKVLSSKQRKRHSADQRRYRRHLISIQDSNRHSFTFGHFPAESPNKRLTKAELSLDPNHLAKLSKLTNLPDNTAYLLATLGSSQPPILVPHRSISHQHLTLPQKHLRLSRAHSESHAKTVEREADPIEPEELVELLRAEQEGGSNVFLIDVRNLMDFQKRRIRGSLNVNLPSLLIKRYQRGTVSNFNLENFITTSEGRDIYASKRQTPTGNSLLEQKAIEAELKLKKPVWVVYDDTMPEDEQTSQAWTLLNVLERFIGLDKTNNGQVFYLCGGFVSFEAHYLDWIESSSTNTLPSMPTPPPVKLNLTPRRSVSYTIGESRNKRTSLFSLDTQAARANNANALARRAKRRSSQTVVQKPQMNQVAEDDETSPRTETDFGFIISEIIPGFLFVGPEIETMEQSDQLNERRIKRVLNMAEECHDEGLSKQSIVYYKISARDTVDMKNIELVMMEAVRFIEDAKRNHEPIYVHCKAGKSRSITAILAYLVTAEHWTLKRAYRHVIKARPNISPNIGFISELMKMEGKVHGRVSSFLESDWQATSLPSPEYAKELFRLEQAWQTAETTV